MSQFWPPKIIIKFLGKSWNNFEVGAIWVIPDRFIISAQRSYK